MNAAHRKQGQQESVLVIILAETRAHEHTFDLFKRNLLNVMNADLCLCVADNEREDTENPFYQHARYIWRYEEPEDWGEAFDDLRDRRGLQNDWRKLLEIQSQWLGGVKGKGEHPGSAAILLFFRLFLKEMILKHEILEMYDRFVITRSDFIHKIPHLPLSFLDPSYIWIPKGEDYRGYTDRHIVVPRQYLLKVLSIGERIITDPETLFSEMKHYEMWNLETFIKFSFTRLGLQPVIRRFPYTMYTIRPSGGHTRWRSGTYSEELGYYIKYKSEYRRYRLASRLIQKEGDWNRPRLFLFNLLQSLMESRLINKLFNR